jgi:signal transduction histidine kinase
VALAVAAQEDLGAVAVLDLGRVVAPYAREQERYGREMVIRGPAGRPLAMVRPRQSGVMPLRDRVSAEVYGLPIVVELRAGETGPLAVTPSTSLSVAILVLGGLAALCLATTLTLAQSAFERNERLRHDIEKRHRVEQDLRGTSEALQRAQAIAHLGSWTWSPSRRRLHCSDEFHRIYGFAPGDDPGWLTLDAVMARVHPEDSEAVRLTMRDAIEHGASFTVHHRVIRSDGIRFLNVQGEVTRIGEAPWDVTVSGMVQDVTERHLAAQALADRTRALERSNRELEEFAYVASHDLQEPLRMVASFCQLLAERYTNALDDEGREYVAFAVDGAERMQGLIRDLLAYSRVGTRAAARETIETNPVVARALANLKAAIGESRAIVEVDALPAVHADGGQLVHVFQNLVGNALKFRGDAPPRVRISATVIDGRAQFAVSDNGIGLKPEHAERIFVMFQRLHKRGSYAGTGIGLAICKKIVERHDGRIWVESVPEQGATFYFTVPLAGAAARTPVERAA